MDADALKLPSLRALARHALPHLLEATLIPLALFYTFLGLAGIRGAILASLAWSYGAVARRLVRRERVPGLLVLGVMSITARTLAALVSGSTFFYFLQPSLTAVAIGGLFLLSTMSRSPLAERLAGDLLPLPAALLAKPAIRRVFMQITLLWSFINILNAALAIGLLLSQSVAVYMVAKTVMSLTITGAALAVSARLFLRTARHPDIIVGPVLAIAVPLALPAAHT